MRIVLTGGGSGGHITPLLAVADELKRLRPDVELIYIGQRGDPFANISASNPSFSMSYTVPAGKFRRYHGGGLKQLADLPTLLKNARDAGRVVRGLTASRRLLKRLEPDVVFIKGGFVGVPVGLAAAQLHIPFVTHDSDAVPGLANRIIARWATYHAVALPVENYNYPKAKTRTVGVPVQDTYVRVTPKLQTKYKAELGLPKGQVLLVTGGGLGAQRLNKAVVTIAPALLHEFPDLTILHLTGERNEAETTTLYKAALTSTELARVHIHGFAHDLYRYSGAADVVIARAGATNLAEFALQAKACIIVPNPDLTGGHQIHNAKLLSKHQAVITIEEAGLYKDVSGTLGRACASLLQDNIKQHDLGDRLHQYAHPEATKELAQLILKTISSVSPYEN